jgi:hypothetical protein
MPISSNTALRMKEAGCELRTAHRVEQFGPSALDDFDALLSVCHAGLSLADLSIKAPQAVAQTAGIWIERA